MKGKILALFTISAALVLVVVLQTTNPSTIGPVGLLAVFFLLYVIIMGCFTELIYVASKCVHWIGKKVMIKRPPVAMSVTRSWYFASLYALAPIILLAMQSVGSLGAYEGLLVGVFLIIGTLYISKRAPS